MHLIKNDGHKNYIAKRDTIYASFPNNSETKHVHRQTKKVTHIGKGSLHKL